MIREVKSFVDWFCLCIVGGGHGKRSEVVC